MNEREGTTPTCAEWPAPCIVIARCTLTACMPTARCIVTVCRIATVRARLCHSRAGGNPVILLLVVEVFPLRVETLDEPQLPYSSPFFQSLLTSNRRLDILEPFAIHQHGHAILAGESSCLLVLMFPDAPLQIVCYTRVERPISLAGQDVHVVVVRAAVPRGRVTSAAAGRCGSARPSGRWECRTR